MLQPLDSVYAPAMESLALLATVIVAPAMFGGPIALLLTFWKLSTASKFRKLTIYALSASSSIVGIFLIVQNISPGARNIGLVGILTGAVATWRLSKRK